MKYKYTFGICSTASKDCILIEHEPKEDILIMKKLKALIIPPGSEIQVAAFNILAVCGILVSIVTAFYNLFAGFGILSFLECMSGVVISLGLMFFTRKTGNYRIAMILTVFIIFIGLFTFLYFTNGEYYGGVPFFFVFAVVFTAFLLDGGIMPILIVIELVWYAALVIYTSYHPSEGLLTDDVSVRAADIVVCGTIVSISLAITMFCQIKVYKNKQQELNNAILVAKEASRAKSDFLAKMSHDIRTPLNTILAVNEMIVNNTSSSQIREWVNDSNASGKILLTLIDDMLDLTRIEAGKINLQNKPYSPEEVFGDIKKTWKIQTESSGLSFEYEIAEDVPGQLLGDWTVIRKITDNLLSNAVKYTKEGSVSLKVGWKKSLVIEVCDTGIGIEKEYLKKVFKPFERGVQDIYRETSGSGLGLAIVKELTDAMGGKITCESEVGKGSVFKVVLPQYVHTDSKAESTHGDNSAKSDMRMTKQIVAPGTNILVVDDNPYNRKVLKGFLEPSLIQVDDVESGFEAIEMIDIKKYDLVLMDLRMPKMDGAETLDKIKKEYPDFDTPVIALTADITNGIEEKLLSQGFEEFISKPVGSSTLFEVLAKFIPDKLVPLETDENEKVASDIERYKSILGSHGVELNVALEYSAGDVGEFLSRAELFEQFADENLDSLRSGVEDERFYIHVHSVKSIAKGVGAGFLANLLETVELRKDDEFSKQVLPVIINEFERVRKGFLTLIKEVRQGE